MKVAPSYKDSKIISFFKDDDGKAKAKIQIKCDRCMNGVFITRVENGQPVPHPNCGGVCFKCGGAGYLTKIVKAYTDDEYDKYIANQEKVKQKKDAAAAGRKTDAEVNSENNKVAYLKNAGYDIENPTVYVVAGGNTYAIRDELKSRGAFYDKAIGWFFKEKVALPTSYYFVEIPFFDLFDWNPYRKTATYKFGTHDIVKERVRATMPASASQWQGNIKDHLTLDLTCVNKIILNNEWGTTTLYTFKDANDNIYTWFSSSCKTAININDTLTLKGTVKDHTTYEGVNQTVLTRCRVERGE